MTSQAAIQMQRIPFSILNPDTFENNSFGYFLQSYLASASEELRATIMEPILGPNEKEQALRQVILALRNTLIYYGYKGVLNCFGEKITELQKSRLQSLSEMIKLIEKEEEIDWKALKNQAEQFIAENFNYYKWQPKVERITPYLIFSLGKAILVVKGHFYHRADIELIFPDKASYKPVESSEDHLTFQIQLSDIDFSGNGLCNHYQMALLKCPWKHKGTFSSKSVEPQFELIMGVFPPPGKVQYVVKSLLDSDKKSIPLNWNEVIQFSAKEGSEIEQISFKNLTGHSFPISDLPEYVRIDAVQVGKEYEVTTIFPFKEE